MTKKRITITLSDEVLTQVDGLVDGTSIRNRSHAIESILMQQLGHDIDTAVVLVGGSPASVTSTLAEVEGAPLITHVVAYLKSHSFRHVLLVTDQQPETFQSLFGADETVQIVAQPAGRGTAGALRLLTPRLHKPFVVIHGDIYTDLALDEVLTVHQAHGHMATICVTPKKMRAHLGRVEMRGSTVTRFVAQPTPEAVGMASMGLYVFEPSMLSRIPEGEMVMLEDTVLPKLVEDGELMAFVYEGTWVDNLE